MPRSHANSRHDPFTGRNTKDPRVSRSAFPCSPSFSGCARIHPSIEAIRVLPVSVLDFDCKNRPALQRSTERPQTGKRIFQNDRTRT